LKNEALHFSNREEKMFDFENTTQQKASNLFIHCEQSCDEEKLDFYAIVNTSGFIAFCSIAREEVMKLFIQELTNLFESL
jgi:hypothetical protein